MGSSTRPVHWASGSSESRSIIDWRRTCGRWYLKKTLRGWNGDNRSCIDVCFLSNPYDPTCTPLNVKSSLLTTLPAPHVRSHTDRLRHQRKGEIATLPSKTFNSLAASPWLRRSTGKF